MINLIKPNYRPIITQEQKDKLREMLENPVQISKIEFIKNMLSDDTVNAAWLAFRELPYYLGSGPDILKNRQNAWNNYVSARNSYIKNLMQ